MLNVCSTLARDTDKMSGPFKEMHVCFYHDSEYYLCCELCGGGGRKDEDDDYDGVCSNDFLFCVCETSTYGIAYNIAFAMAL